MVKKSQGIEIYIVMGIVISLLIYVVWDFFKTNSVNTSNQPNTNPITSPIADNDNDYYPVPSPIPSPYQVPNPVPNPLETANQNPSASDRRLLSRIFFVDPSSNMYISGIFQNMIRSITNTFLYPENTYNDILEANRSTSLETNVLEMERILNIIFEHIESLLNIAPENLGSSNVSSRQVLLKTILLEYELAKHLNMTIIKANNWKLTNPGTTSNQAVQRLNILKNREIELNNRVKLLKQQFLTSEKALHGIIVN